MARTRYFFLLFIFFSSCATTNKMAQKAFQYALFGQTELTIYSRIGTPTRIFDASDGSKVLIYEFYSWDNVPSFDNLEPENYSSDITSFESKSGAIYDIRYYSDFQKRANNTYQEHVTFLEVFLDDLGYCVGFDYDLSKERLEYFRDHLKAYVPKD